jgi:hypothetical protein
LAGPNRPPGHFIFDGAVCRANDAAVVCVAGSRPRRFNSTSDGKQNPLDQWDSRLPALKKFSASNRVRLAQQCFERHNITLKIFSMECITRESIRDVVRGVGNQKEMLPALLIQWPLGEVAKAAKRLVHCLVGSLFNVSHRELLVCYSFWRLPWSATSRWVYGNIQILVAQAG